MTPLIAHVGHWLTDLLYVAPLAVALGFLFLQSRRDKNREESENAAPTADVPPAT